jgi:O-antigen/teichoic acid export membrane protein
MTSSLGKDIVGIAKLQVVITGIGLVTQIFLARYLGPERKGVFDLFLLIPTVLSSVIDMGLLSANTYLVGKKIAPAEILHSHSVLWSILATVILVFTAIVFKPILHSLFGAAINSYLVLSVALAGPTLYFLLWSSLMYGMDRVRLVYQVNVLSAVLALLVYVAAGYFLNAGVSAFLYATAVFIAVKAIIGFVTVGFETPFRFSLNVDVLKQSLGYGIAIYLGLIVNNLHFRLDQFFVNYLRGPADLANYALAVRIAEMLWLLDYAIINASIFRITSSSVEESTRITQRMARLVGSMVLFGSVILCLLAPSAIPLIFGKGFSPAVLPLMLLIPGIIAWSISRVLAQFIAYQSGKPWYNMGTATVGFSLNLALIVVFIPLWGIQGAAVASSLSYISTLLLSVWVFLRFSKANIISTFIPQKQDLALMKDLVSEYLFPRRVNRRS